MINTDKAKQKNTDISGIDSKFLDDGISVMDKSSLVYRNTILSLLVLLDETHWFQHLIEHDVINFVMDRKI